MILAIVVLLAVRSLRDPAGDGAVQKCAALSEYRTLIFRHTC